MVMIIVSMAFFIMFMTVARAVLLVDSKTHHDFCCVVSVVTILLARTSVTSHAMLPFWHPVWIAYTMVCKNSGLTNLLASVFSILLFIAWLALPSYRTVL